jgi:hypothetical protein
MRQVQAPGTLGQHLQGRPRFRWVFWRGWAQTRLDCKGSRARALRQSGRVIHSLLKRRGGGSPCGRLPGQLYSSHLGTTVLEQPLVAHLVYLPNGMNCTVRRTASLIPYDTWYRGCCSLLEVYHAAGNAVQCSRRKGERCQPGVNDLILGQTRVRGRAGSD